MNDGAGPQLKYVSRFGAYWRETPAAPLALLTYPEVLFLEAEAAERGWIGGSAATFYADAIRASMEQYGIATAAIDAYLAQPRVVYAGGATGLTQIAYQKWLSLFMQGMEGWTEVRRTGVPTVVPGPNAVLPSIPERLPYADNEQVLNRANVDAAVAAQGFKSSTDLTTPLPTIETVRLDLPERALERGCFFMVAANFLHDMRVHLVFNRFSRHPERILDRERRARSMGDDANPIHPEERHPAPRGVSPPSRQLLRELSARWTKMRIRPWLLLG